MGKSQKLGPSLQQWERAERERSAHEALQTLPTDPLEVPKNVARYHNPPADTIYPLEYACHLLGDVKGKTILEYGCGDGVNTVLLANRGAKVISLDLSAELVDIARRRLVCTASRQASISSLDQLMTSHCLTNRLTSFLELPFCTIWTLPCQLAKLTVF